MENQTAVLPELAQLARTLVQRKRFGSLATLAQDPAGYPFGSLIGYAPEESGDLLLLTSDLAEHTHNFKADSRVSLMVADSAEEPLARGRVTLLGRVEPVAEGERAAARTQYLEAHPEAERYIEFRDFHLYRLHVESVRYVGGFGRMSWVSEAVYRQADVDPVGVHHDAIVNHMNEDHRDAMQAILEHQFGVAAERVTMVDVDRSGYTLRYHRGAQSEQVRVAFSAAAESPQDVRRELVSQTRAAREALGRPA